MSHSAKGAVAADVEANKGRVGSTKVKRYWPGRAPEWVDAGQDDAAADAAPKERARTEVAAPVIVKRADDPRLRRLAQAQASHTEEDVEEALQRRRAIHAPVVVRRHREPEEEEDEEKSDVDAIDGDDLRIRAEQREERMPRPSAGEEEAAARPRGARSTEAHADEGEDDEAQEAARRRQAVRDR
jgi:microfibrillar-associated protein 1